MFKKLLLSALLVVLGLTVGGLAYYVWSTVPISAQDFLESGRGYYEQERYQEAVVQLLNAIELEPAAKDARLLLADAYMNQGNVNAAAEALVRLLEYYPDDVDAKLQLGNIYLAGGASIRSYFSMAQEIAEGILEQEPRNTSALVLLGNALVGLQNYTASVERYQEAVGIDPENAMAFLSLGTAQALQSNFAAAENAFLRAREIDPTNRSVLISLANYYSAVGNIPKAAAVFEDMLAEFPADPTVSLAAANFYFQAGRLERAETILVDLQDAMPEDPLPSMLLSDFYTSSDRENRAIDVLIGLKRAFPDNLDVASRLATRFIYTDPDRARQEIDLILEKAPESPIGSILLGELQVASGEYDSAREVFGREAVLNSPYPQPHFFLGNLDMRAGRTSQARGHFEEALRVNADYLPARIGLAEVLLATQRYPEARRVAQEILEARRNYLPARLFLVALDRAEGDYSAAEAAASALLSEYPDNPSVHEQRALIAEAEGRTADAEAGLKRALSLEPDSRELLLELANFYIRTGQSEQAIRTIDTVPDAQKQAADYELIGVVYQQAGKLKESERALKAAIAKAPERASARQYLIAQYLQSGRMDDALVELDQLVERDPFNADALATLGIVHESQGDREEAKRRYSEALAIDSDLVVAANNLAYLLLEDGNDLATALRWAQSARRNEPDSPVIADTLGWVYYKLRNYALAREQLEFATSFEPDNAVFQYHLGMVYKETGQLREAKTALERALRGSDFDERASAEEVLALLNE